MIDQVWWYATRAAGMMTWSTALVAVVLGLLLSTRLLGKQPTGAWLLDLHRFLSALSAVFLAVHVASLWADSYIEFSFADLLVPGVSQWERLPMALGIGAGWALIVVQITSMLRRWMSAEVWKTLHWLSVVTVVSGTVHAVMIGTDVGNWLVLAAAAAGSLVVIALALVRVYRAESGERQKTEHEATLEEMRDRLANLPIPERMPQPTLELAQDSQLPRRAPVRGVAPEPGVRRKLDPFAPASHEKPSAPTSTHLPTTDELLADEPANTPPTPTLGGLPVRGQSAATEAEPAPEPMPEPLPPPQAHDAPAVDPGEPAGTETPMSHLLDDLRAVAAKVDASVLPPWPTSEDAPTTPAATAPEPAPPAPATATPPTPSEPQPVSAGPAPGPPPLPGNAGADQDAYRAWLRDWLAYAEQYGEETPTDPTRV